MMELETAQLDHFGLVAGVFDQLGISEVIDERIPKSRHHKLSHSQVLKAMVLNGLGFVGQRLYLFPSFFENLPVDRLLGEGIVASDLNDDVLGRTFDAIYEYDPTNLFNEIVLRVMDRVDFDTKLIHADTTSFGVHGMYEDEDIGNTIKITLGHPKDGRADLKQFVLSMVTNQHGLPLFVEAKSGNASDKNTIIDTISKLRRNLTFDSSSYYIADSALYTKDNIQKLGDGIRWITRVPATINEAKALLDIDVKMIPCTDSRYSFYSTISNYGGIDQKWVLFHSKPMQQRMKKTFEKQLEKDIKIATASLKKLNGRRFACEPDARKEAEIWLQSHKNYKFKKLEFRVQSKRTNNKIGRPSKNEKLDSFWIIDGDIELNAEVIDKERAKLGRFILASNDLKIDDETMLQHYKGQQSVERGFRFLKDKRFNIAQVYLKKEERIQALAMIMVLTLLIYSIAEWQLRKRLMDTGNFIPNQLKKPTQKPTLKWVFFLFNGVSFVKVNFMGIVHREMMHLTDVLKLILRLMGPECEKYYVEEG
jgi:transposase